MKSPNLSRENRRLPLAKASGVVVGGAILVGLGVHFASHGPSENREPVLDSSVSNEANTTHCSVKPGDKIGTWVVRFLESDYTPAASTAKAKPVIGSATVYADTTLSELHATSATPDNWAYVEHPASFRTKHADPFNAPAKHSETYAILDMDNPTSLKVEVDSTDKPGCTVGQELVSQHTLDRLQTQ